MMPMAVTMHPIWQSGAMILAAGIFIALVLQLCVHRLLPAPLRQDHTALGGAIFSVIGTTYAVLLAFMATTAWEQYSAAQALAQHEADLIGSLYHASRRLPAPENSMIRADLVAYLRHIIDVEWPAQIAGRPVPAAEPLLGRLDREVEEMAPPPGMAATAQGLLASGLADAAMLRRDRRLATHGTVPGLVWIVLLSGGVLMVGFSLLLGAPRPAVHMLMTAALVASSVLVLLLIVGLSSPFHGAVTIRPDAYAGVLAEIQEAP